MGPPGRPQADAAHNRRQHRCQRHGTAVQLAPNPAHPRLPCPHGGGGAGLQSAAAGDTRQGPHKAVPLQPAQGGSSLHWAGRGSGLPQPHRQAACAHAQPVQRPLLAWGGGTGTAGCAVPCGSLLLPLAQGIAGGSPCAGPAAPVSGQSDLHGRPCHNGGGHPREGHLCSSLWQAGQPARSRAGAACNPGGPPPAAGAHGSVPPHAAPGAGATRPGLAATAAGARARGRRGAGAASSTGSRRRVAH